MIIAPLAVSLFGATLAITVATHPLDDATGATSLSSLSSQEKVAATQPLVRSATDCIVQAVAADPRFKTNAALGDLIVELDAVMRHTRPRHDRCLRSLLWRRLGRGVLHGALSRRAAQGRCGEGESGIPLTLRG